MIKRQILICNNFQCFLFQHQLMKNPFQNTSEYTVVREFNRIAIRQRSLSNSSQASNISSQSSKFQQWGPVHSTTKTHKYQARIDREYMVHTSRTPVYEVERKRAMLFGLEELRYRPTYFEGLSEVPARENISLGQRQIADRVKPSSLKTQKSIKQIRFTENINSEQLSQKNVSSAFISTFPHTQSRYKENKEAENDPLKQLSKARWEQQQYIQEKKSQKVLIDKNRRKSKQQPIQTQKTVQEKQAPPVKQRSSRKKGSILEEMIQLNINDEERNNQFYSSIADLKSRGQLTKPQSSYRHKNKKTSVFYDEYQKFADLVIKKTEQPHCSSEFNDEKLSESQISNEEIPVKIHRKSSVKSNSKIFSRMSRSSLKIICPKQKQEQSQDLIVEDESQIDGNNGKTIVRRSAQNKCRQSKNGRYNQRQPALRTRQRQKLFPSIIQVRNKMFFLYQRDIN